MDERTHTRLAFLFASMNHSPHLAAKLIEVVQQNHPILGLDVVRDEVVGWARDLGAMDHRGLQFVATALLRHKSEEVVAIGRVLAHELDVNPPPPSSWLPGTQVTRPDGRTGKIDKIDRRNPRTLVWVQKDEAPDEFQAFYLDELTRGAQGN